MGTDPKEKEELSRTVARIQAGVLSIACGLIGGLGLFIMTVWLLLEDGPHVGSHLQLLSNYFIGYSVTWGGSLIGLFYGTLTGGILGWTVGYIYNKVAGIRQGKQTGT
ncbi:MAG: hypothetical protein AB7P17_04685 [Nitrospirales bacterium]|nr:hypothetical protein [Nitrospirales bacterium]